MIDYGLNPCPYFVGIALIALGAFGVGGLCCALGVVLDNDILVNVGIAILILLLAITAVTLIVFGVCLIRG